MWFYVFLLFLHSSGNLIIVGILNVKIFLSLGNVHLGASITEGTLKSQVDKITWPVKINQFLYQPPKTDSIGIWME